MRLLILVLSLIVLFPVAPSAQNHDGGEIIFTGCPPYVQGNHCDSIFYQVVAVHIETMKSCSDIRYHLVEGPGYINEKTGLWVYHPTEWPWFHDSVEIAASHGADTTSGEDNCRFAVKVVDQALGFNSYCGAHLNILPFDTMRVPVSVFDSDSCDDPVVVSAEFLPEPDGWWSFDSANGYVEFVPTYSDSGKSFNLLFRSSERNGCRVYVDVFPEPVVEIAIESITEAKPGDTVDVDVDLMKCPFDLEQIELLIDGDSDKLTILDVVPGEAFYGSPDGCDWPLFLSFHNPTCSTETWEQTWPVGIALQSFYPATGETASCNLPDTLPATIVTLRVIVGEENVEPLDFGSIDFLWCDCNSNSLSTYPYHNLLTTKAVFDSSRIYVQPIELPGYAGNLDECYSSPEYYIERYRNVVYYNGGINIVAPPAPPPPPSDYVIKAGIVNGPDGLGVARGQIVEAPLTLTRYDSTSGLGGFDLFLGYDADKLAFQEATPGGIYDQCGWEYFTYRYGPLFPCDENCPSGMLRVVGIAETNNGPSHPYDSCLLDNIGWINSTPSILANLKFLTGGPPMLESTFVPLFFFWQDCGDNILSAYELSDLYISAHIYPLDADTSIDNDEVGFPTNLGAQEVCPNESPDYGRLVLRRVDFHNGGILIAADQITDVDDQADLDLPVEFALSQNYPNPFNPSTSIDFALPRSGRVSIELYNVLGRRVAALLDETLPAGNHTVTWDGRDISGKPVSSGVYFYRITAGEFVDSRKMLLLK